VDKILFIVPPNIKYDDFDNPAFNVQTVSKKSGNFGSIRTETPLGVLSMSAYIKKFTPTQTMLIDFNIVLTKLETFGFRSFAEFFQDFLSAPMLTNYTPSIIGISTLYSTSYQNMLDIAQCCRDIFPSTVIVAGGGRANKYV